MRCLDKITVVCPIRIHWLCKMDGKYIPKEANENDIHLANGYCYSLSKPVIYHYICIVTFVVNNLFYTSDV